MQGVLQLHSHKPPILHRDLKSPNMLVDRHWRVKVTDFNLSRMVKTGSTNASVTSMLANNPRWLAPEVISTATIATIIITPLIVSIIMHRNSITSNNTNKNSRKLIVIQQSITFPARSFHATVLTALAGPRVDTPNMVLSVYRSFLLSVGSQCS